MCSAFPLIRFKVAMLGVGSSLACASQWFRPSVLLLRGGGHSSVGRWLSLGCEGPRVRIGGLGRSFAGQSSRVWWGSWCSLSAL
ncbi:hypothetical protein DY000_02018405 [Brassica cretica]|uniref:Secreted protein n=1 Tax=Brassica cretica TaxID=69181 RepID=A0ABQ7DAI0_BRACR|nr:hypothetical protein DY000_02018405 [Brassica cretica]